MPNATKIDMDVVRRRAECHACVTYFRMWSCDGVAGALGVVEGADPWIVPAFFEGGDRGAVRGIGGGHGGLRQSAGGGAEQEEK